MSDFITKEADKFKKPEKKVRTNYKPLTISEL